MRRVPLRVLLNVVALLAVTSGLVVYAFVNWVGTGLVKDTYAVTVPMPEAGGILPAQQVTVRGHEVGKVADLHLTRDGVDFELEIDGDEHVPERAVVQILRRSPIGEQTLDFIPVPPDWEPPPGAHASGTDRPPVIPARLPVHPDWTAAARGSRVVPVLAITPSSVPELLDRADELLGAIDGGDLGTVVHELGVAFAGRTEVLKGLNRDSAELGATLVDGIPEFERLLASSEEVLAVLRDHADTLAGSFTDAADLSDTLAQNRPTLEAIVDHGTLALREADALVRTERADLSCLLDDLLVLNERFATEEHRAELATLLDNNTYFYSGFDAGTQWDPYRPGVIWARVNILLTEEPGGQLYAERRPTPATLPGAACESPFGLGVNAVRQDEPIVPPDPTSPGIEYAPLVAGPRASSPPPSGGGGASAAPAGSGPRRGSSVRGDDLPATGGGPGALMLVPAAAALGLFAGRRRP